MKFISLFTRLGLLALGFLLVAIVNDDAVWASPSDTAPPPRDWLTPCSMNGAWP